MGGAINGFIVNARFAELSAIEIKCLVFANLLLVKDSDGRIDHVKDNEAVVCVVGVKERIITNAWDKRVLIIVWVFFAENGFDEMCHRVRFVCTKVKVPVLETWILVQIKFRMASNRIALINAKAIGLKPPITTMPSVPGNDLWIFESNVKSSGIAIVFGCCAEIVARFGNAILNGTVGVSLKRPHLDVSIRASIAPNDAIPDVCWIVVINASVSFSRFVFYNGTIIEDCSF